LILLTMSMVTEDGIANVKKAACEALLEVRTSAKLKSSRMEDIANRMHLAVPVPRDNIERPPHIPESVGMGSKEVFLERQREWETERELYYEMDPDHQSLKHQKRYLLENLEWNFDKIPEIMDGKNIADFYYPDLLAKLEQIEREELVRLRKEEEEMAEEAAMDAQMQLTPEQKDMVRRIREKRGELIAHSRMKKTNSSDPAPRTSSLYQKTFNEFQEHLESMGLDGAAIAGAVKARSKSRSKSRSESRPLSSSRARSESRTGRKRTREDLERSLTPKPGEGFRNVKQKTDAITRARRSQRAYSRDGRQGEGDRHYFDPKPKHLYSGKSTVGKKDYR